MNPLKALQDHGQAVWLDFLARGFTAKGGLKKLVDDDGLRGVTSNPSIFEQAIGHSDEYDDAIARMLDANDRAIGEIFRRARGRGHQAGDRRAAAGSMTPPRAPTAMSASRSRRISPTIPLPPSPRPGGCGARSIART